jgi:hypothetical protein
MDLSSFAKKSAFILSVCILSLALSYTILAWTNPKEDPPGNNIDTPINDGSTDQSKSGDLSVGSGLKIWLSKLGDSFALKNDSGTGLLVIGQDGNTGVGVESPGAKLEIAGQVKITGGAPGAGKMLVSDAAGLGSWKTAAEIGIGGTLPAGTSNQTLRHNGTTWVGNSNLFNDGTNVGIGTTTPSAKLDLNGQIRIRGGSPALGKVLVSDGVGLATWQNPATGIVPSDCGAGTAVIGIDAGGNLICGRQVNDSACPGSQFAKGIDPSGNVICENLPPLCITTSCPTLGYTCGAWPDGCGGALSCGTCATGMECSVGTCKSSCVPTTCSALGYACGTPSDGCGGTLNCGSCLADDICIAGACKDSDCKDDAPGGAKKIFVTSTTYAGTDTNTDAKADAICATHAGNGGLSGTFKAFIYLGSRLPEAVLPAGKAFYNGQMTEGHCEWKLVAVNPNNFWNLPLLAPIRYDEFGSDPGSSVWTGYKSAGGSTRTLLAPLGTSCCGFTDTFGKTVNCWPCVGGKGVDTVNKCGSFGGPYGDARAYYGLNSATDNSWSGLEYYQRTNVNCAYPNGCNRTNEVLPTCQAVTRSLYCVEQ